MTEKITVYVRLEDNDESRRTLAFKRIPEVTDADALAHGYAVDGNAYICGISSYQDEDENRRVSLAEALFLEEKQIVQWMKGLNIEVEFD